MTKIEISLKTLLIIGALILLYKFIIRIEYIIILVLLAYITMAAIDPIVQFLTRRKVNRILSIILIYISAVAILVGISVFAFKPILTESIEFFKQFPTIIEKYPAVKDLLPKNFVSNSNQNLQNYIGGSNFTTIFNTIHSLFAGVAALLSMIVMSIYMLLYKDDNYKSLSEIISPRHAEKTMDIIRKIEKKLGFWVQAQLILSLFIAVAYYIGLSVLKIKFGLTLSLLAGFLEVIPVAGPVITAIIVSLITLVIDPSKIIYFLIFALIIQQTEAHVLVPKIMQKVIGLNPLITIVALLIGTEYFGVIGAILSVPIAAILQIIYQSYNKK